MAQIHHANYGLTGSDTSWLTVSFGPQTLFMVSCRILFSWSLAGDSFHGLFPETLFVYSPMDSHHGHISTPVGLTLVRSSRPDLYSSDSPLVDLIVAGQRLLGIDSSKSHRRPASDAGLMFSVEVTSTASLHAGLMFSVNIAVNGQPPCWTFV
jgi:hypothetical protein